MTEDRKLRDGWRLVRFGDVVRQVKDRVDPETAGIDRFVAGEHMDTDDLRIRRWGHVGDGYLGPAFHMRFKPDQVLYGSRRTYLRKVAVADFEGICANTTFVIEPAGEELLPGFLPLVMTTEAFHEHSIKQSKGSVNPYINFRDIAWFEFPLPSVEEQREMVELQAAVDAVDEAFRSVRAAAEVVEEALRIELGAAGDLVPLERVAEVVDCEHKTAPLEGGPNYLIGTPDFRDGLLTFEGPRWVSDEVYDEWTRRGAPLPGDVVLARQAPIGAVALVPDSPRVCLGQQVVLIRPIGRTSEGTLLYHYLRGREAQADIARASGGSAHPHLNMKAIRALPVPEPRLVDPSLVAGLNGAMEVGRRAKAALSRLGWLRRQLREVDLGGGL